MRFALRLLTVFTLFAGASQAQPTSPPLWGGLKPGPYKVGFKVMWEFDYTRAWTTTADPQVSGQLPGRPVRIAVWYPAVSAGKQLMPVEGYLRPPTPAPFATFGAEMVQADIGGNGRGVRGLFKSEQYYNALLRTPSGAYANAVPRAGRYPVIIYALGQGDHNLENPVLCEYLASHGYVVATVPSIGVGPLRRQLMVHDPESFDAQVRDLLFALQTMNHFPNADGSRLGMAGMSMGGLYSVIAAMQIAPSVKAIVGLDASILGTLPSFGYKYTQVRSFDRAHMKAPILELHRPENAARSAILDSLTYSDRYFVMIPGAVHVDFNGFPFMTAPGRAPASEVDSFALSFRNQARGLEIGRAVVEATRQFFDAFVKNDSRAKAAIGTGNGNGVIDSRIGARVEFLPGVKGPTEEELVSTLLSRGEAAALAQYESAARRYEPSRIARERIFRRVANELNYTQQPADALKVFKLAAAIFKSSPEAARDLAENYLAARDTTSALQEYRRAVKLEPQDTATANLVRALENARR